MPTGGIFTLRPGNVVLLPQNSAHRLSHVDNESTCIVCGTLRLQHSARYFLTSLPETLFLAPLTTAWRYNWLAERRSRFSGRNPDRRAGGCCVWICATFFTLAVRGGLHRLILRKTFSVLLLHPRLGADNTANAGNARGHAWTVESAGQHRSHMSGKFAQLFP